jgi:D-amino-acid dehydrogenase
VEPVLSERPIHVAVIGAGIVGLSVAYHLVQCGARVTVVDRDPQGDKASLGNAGGIAVTEVMPASASGALFRLFGWMLDPLGPLTVRPTHAPRLIPFLLRFARAGTPGEVERISRALAAINLRVYDDLVPMLTGVGLASELYRRGALTVYETEAGYRRDAVEWACKRSHGIVCEEVSGNETRRMEPALGAHVHCAVLTPQWSYVSDPKRIVDGLKAWLLRAGITVTQGEVDQIVPGEPRGVSILVKGGSRLPADQVVVAAGAWSGRLAVGLGDRVLLESERGYNMTLRDSGVSLERQLIFAERKFVATPLQVGLRIGGAAEFGGLSAKANYKRSRVLVELARRYLPSLRTDGGTSWAGHRPTTPDSLPVISRSRHQANVFYAFGHGHLGLTQAATTGRLISDLIFQTSPPVEMSAYDIGRFA